MRQLIMRGTARLTNVCQEAMNSCKTHTQQSLGRRDMDGDGPHNDILGGLHSMIPFGVAQTGFVGAAVAVAVLGVVPAHGTSIMDNTVPLPTVLISFGALVASTWAVSRYTRQFVTKPDMDRMETRLSDKIDANRDELVEMIRSEMERRR